MELKILKDVIFEISRNRRALIINKFCETLK